MGLGITISVNGKNDAALANASKVEVFESIGATTLYTITYPEDIADGDLPMIKDARLDPGSQLCIAAEENDSMVCLVKGPVFEHEISLVHGGEGSVLRVKGGDSGLMMDKNYKSTLWSNVTDSDVVTTILSKYKQVPDVKSTDTRHIDSKHSLVQVESDLRFIRRLARRNGCDFWITCALPGEIETGHFQRPKLDESPAAELLINTADANLTALNILWNTDRPNAITAKQLDLSTKDLLDGDVNKSPQTILGSKSLQDIAGSTNIQQLSSPVDDAGDLKARNEAALIENDWFVRVRCSTSLHLLKKLVRAHSIVTLSGAGSRHSGKYLVYSVRHMIDATTHLMDIELVRNGWNESSAAGGLLSKIF